MRRDPGDLHTTRHDLVIVGGGIHGLFAAYDAASRGLGVALIERGDFGGALSFNHQRTIHGGLRDVAAGRFRKARRQIAERHAWARMTPHLIRPLPFLVGTYRFTKRSRLALRAGFAVYDVLGRSQNSGVPPELHLPRARLESPTTTRRLFQGIADRGLSGGAVWYDYQTLHPDRVNWTVALAAMAAGARLTNYVEAIGPVTEQGRLAGVRVRDLVTGREQDVPAAAVLLAAGSGLGAAQEAFGVTGAPPLVRAMNLLVDRPARDIALAAPGSSGRMLTAVPWRGAVLVGTHQSDDVLAGPETQPSSGAIDDMLHEVASAFPALDAGRQDIRFVHHGLAPAVRRNGRADLLSEPVLTAHTRHGQPALFSLVGVKFTTARHAAETAVTAICRRLGRTTRACATAERALPHAGIADVEGRLAETLRDCGATLDRDIADHLAGWYGTEAPAVVLFSAERSLLDRLSPNAPVTAGEVAYAAMHAHAVHLTDVVLRRTPLGSAGHPGRAAIERAAAIMGDACGWNEARRNAEIARVEDRYAGVKASGPGRAPMGP